MRTTEDMLQLIPPALREAAVALGAPKWKVIVLICYRAAKDGIVTGVLLAVARIAGETAPLLFTSLGNLNWSISLDPADGQPAGDHLSIRRVGVRGLGAARLGRRAADHGRRAGHQHSWRGSRCAAGAERNEHNDERAAGTAERASAACRRGPRSAINEPRIAIRNLDFFYGSNQALKKINLDLPDRQVTGMIGPSGCGKSTLLRVLNRMYDLYPGQRATGEVMMDGENIIDPYVDLNALRATDRHGVPEADAVPDDDLRQHRVRREAAREAVESRQWTSAWSGR